MINRVQKLRVTLNVAVPLEIEPGVVLPTGAYTAEEKRLGVPVLGGQISWTEPDYTLKISEAQLAVMGAKLNRNVISTEYDLTKFVRLGQITVS